MTDFNKLVIEPLHTTHERTGFNCGVESLDRYLKKQACQDIKRRISRVFVVTFLDKPNKILGYYSLSTLSIQLCQLPEKLARKLPKYPIPAALIGRLAVSSGAQGNGIGKMLLVDAIKRTMSVGDQIAIYAMAVDAINAEAERFYEQFGFTLLSGDSRRLFLPLLSFENITSFVSYKKQGVGD
jgi:GNAT superfamily N-acetyltransferase